MPFDLLDKWRDEDYWLHNEDFHVRVEVGDRQQSKDVRLAAPVGRVPGGDKRRVATPLPCAPFVTLALFVLAFTLYALGVHA